jgi:hypothetical protein
VSPNTFVTLPPTKDADTGHSPIVTGFLRRQLWSGAMRRPYPTQSYTNLKYGKVEK